MKRATRRTLSRQVAIDVGAVAAAREAEFLAPEHVVLDPDATIELSPGDLARVLRAAEELEEASQRPTLRCLEVAS
jgi:hypothetical protein